MSIDHNYSSYTTYQECREILKEQYSFQQHSAWVYVVLDIQHFAWIYVVLDNQHFAYTKYNSISLPGLLLWKTCLI